LNNKISIIHPTCSPFARNAALSFAEANILNEVITTIGFNTRSRLNNLIPTLFRKRLNNIYASRLWDVPKGFPIKYHPLKESIRILLLKSNLNESFNLSQNNFTDWIYKSLDEHAAQQHLNNIKAIYAYEDCASSTFKEAKKRGILCFYDLPIIYFQMAKSILNEEAEIFPELRSSLQTVNEPNWKIERKKQEVDLADHIFVPSRFVRQSLIDANIPIDKISVINYGAPIEYFYPLNKKDDTFRAIFVGRVGPRKGVHYLIKAWNNLKLPNAELLIVGINEFTKEWSVKNFKNLKYIKSLPHHSLNTVYCSANVLVLPTLVEGLAQVQLESMACGIPVITTPNSGSDDIISNGKEGFIIPKRNVDSLAEKIEWCFLNQEELKQMGIVARKKAEELSWGKYRKRLAEKVQNLLNNNI